VSPAFSFSAPRIARAEPVFHQPLMAYRSHVRGIGATAPRTDQRHDGGHKTQPDHNPNGIHEQPFFFLIRSR
jgi:hypothetical protein